METKKSSLIVRLVFLINGVAIVFLLLSYLAAYVSPRSDFWWLQFFGLAYGILLAINIFFILFWLFVQRRKTWYSLIAILIGINRIFAIVQPGITTEKAIIKNGAYPIKVMTFNVRVFDLYNWSGKHELRKKILDFLKAESPDIVCFQEYYTSEGTALNYRMTDSLAAIIPAAYSHVEYSTTLHNNLDHWGIATFSKYPIVRKQALHFQQRNRNIFLCTDILAGNDTLRIINTHLESIRFKPEDYKFIENIGNEKQEEELNSSLNILRKMKRAYSKRAKQVETLKEEITRSPYSVILCGDFNDTPGSYSYQILSDGLTDSFRESGKGFGKTYAGSFPSFRIDYILHDKKLKSFNYKTYRENLSDHYPISCMIYKE